MAHGLNYRHTTEFKMSMLTKEQKESFDKNGYLVIERGIPYENFEKAREAAESLLDKCGEIDYPYYRTDTRISNDFIEKLDHIFHPDIFESELFKVVIESQILEYAKDVLGEDDIYMTFNRMHSTRGYSTWSSWHRDDMPNRKHLAIKATIPLYNEVGFAVVPGSHKIGDNEIEGNNTNVRSPKSNQVNIPVKAGDLLLFDTGIVHRGACAGRTKSKRAHIHFQFTPTKYAQEVSKTWDDWLDRPELLELANDSWKEILTKKIDVKDYYKTTTPNKQATTFSEKLNQALVKLYYYSSALLPQDSKYIQEPNQKYLPYIKVPKKYKNYFD